MTYPKIAFLGKYFPIQAIASSSFSLENIFSIWAAVNWKLSETTVGVVANGNNIEESLFEIFLLRH